MPAPLSYDLFVSHALADKTAFTQPLVDALRARGLRIWYSSENLQVGDTLTAAVNEAIRHSRFCLAIVSPAFLDSRWTQLELDAFVAQETDHQTRILPIWHHLAYEDVKARMPLFAGRFALNSEIGIDALVEKIHQVVQGKRPLVSTSATSFWKKPWIQSGKRVGILAGMASLIGGIFLGRTVINHVQGTQINVPGNQNTILVNPSEGTYKQQQFEGAFQLVTAEVLENVGKASAMMMGLAMNPPEPFWRSRDPNESLSAFKLQALQHHASYQQSVAQRLQAFVLRQDAYRPNSTILMHNPKVGQACRSMYRAFEAWEGIMNDYSEGLVLHQKMGSWHDEERTAQNLALYREKVRKAQIELLQVAGQACWVYEGELEMIQESLALAGISVALAPGEVGFRRCAELSARLGREVTEDTPIHPAQPGPQTLVRSTYRITDPSMLLRRKQLGKPDTLTPAEVDAMNQADPSELLSLAGLSFLAFDGRASVFYLQRALEAPGLSALQQQYLRQSIDRLEHPDKYQGSLGIWVMEVEPGGGFAAAGLQSGDVIIAIDGRAVDQVLEINQALARLDEAHVVLDLIRDDQVLRKTVSTRSAGAKMTQLVMWGLVGG